MEKKNIVLIVADTARAANFSFYGYNRNTAPFLAELANEGILYNNVYSQSIWTLPSHASIFTGEYPFEHQKISSKSKLKENPLLDKLSEEGYTNIGLSNNAYISEEFGWQKGFDYFRYIQEAKLFVSEEENPIWDEMRELESKVNAKEKYKRFIKHCVRNFDWKELANAIYLKLNKKFWIGDQGAKNTNRIAKSKIKEAENPFFLFINYIEPHSPYKPPREYRNEFKPERITEDQYSKFFETSRYNEKVMSGELKITDEDLDIQKSLYDAEIRYLDERIRELYEYLEAEGILDDTIFIFTSDHGEYFGEHGLHRHAGGLEKEALEVPLIIKHPNKGGGEKKGNFELKQLYNYIICASEGKKPEIKGKSEAYSEYYAWLEKENLEIEEHWKNYQCSIQNEGGIFILDNENNSRYRGKVDKEKYQKALREHFKSPLTDPFQYLPDKNDEVDEKVKNQLEKLGYNI